MKNLKTDEELVLLIVNKDKEYFSELISRYQDKLMVYIKRITQVDESGAEDILQDSFIKAYRNINNFDTNLKFSSWIYRIVHNEVISAYRKSTSKGKDSLIEVDEFVMQNISDDFDTVAFSEGSITAEFIQKALLEIDYKYKEVIILRYFEQKNYKEISDILKKPTNTIATQLSRAKKELRKKINNISNNAYEK